MKFNQPGNKASSVAVFLFLSFSSLLAVLSGCGEKKNLSTRTDECAELRERADKWKLIEDSSKSYLNKKERYIIDANKDKPVILSDPFSNADQARKYLSEIGKDVNGLRILQGNKEPTSSAWVDFATLSHIMELLEKEKGDGIRIYFSKYDKYDPAHPDPLRVDKGIYDNQYTVILATTKPQGNNHITFWNSVMVGGVPSCAGLYNYNELCPPQNNCFGITIP